MLKVGGVFLSGQTIRSRWWPEVWVIKFTISSGAMSFTSPSSSITILQTIHWSSVFVSVWRNPPCVPVECSCPVSGKREWQLYQMLPVNFWLEDKTMESVGGNYPSWPWYNLSPGSWSSKTDVQSSPICWILWKIPAQARLSVCLPSQQQRTWRMCCLLQNIKVWSVWLGYKDPESLGCCK